VCHAYSVSIIHMLTGLQERSHTERKARCQCRHHDCCDVSNICSCNLHKISWLAYRYRAGPLIDAFMDHFRLRNPRQLRCTANSREFKAFNRFAKGLMIFRSNPTGDDRRKRIRCLVPEGAAGRVFQLQDGQERTVQVSDFLETN
jgi:hypothetical protein